VLHAVREFLALVILVLLHGLLVLLMVTLFVVTVDVIVSVGDTEEDRKDSEETHVDCWAVLVGFAVAVYVSLTGISCNSRELTMKVGIHSYCEKRVMKINILRKYWFKTASYIAFSSRMKGTRRSPGGRRTI